MVWEEKKTTAVHEVLPEEGLARASQTWLKGRSMSRKTSQRLRVTKPITILGSVSLNNFRALLCFTPSTKPTLLGLTWRIASQPVLALPTINT